MELESIGKEEAVELQGKREELIKLKRSMLILKEIFKNAEPNRK